MPRQLRPPAIPPRSSSLGAGLSGTTLVPSSSSEATIVPSSRNNSSRNASSRSNDSRTNTSRNEPRPDSRAHSFSTPAHSINISRLTLSRLALSTTTDSDYDGPTMRDINPQRLPFIPPAGPSANPPRLPPIKSTVPHKCHALRDIGPDETFPCVHVTRNLRTATGTYVFPLSFTPSEYFISNEIVYPQYRLKLKHCVVFFDLRGPYSNQERLMADVRIMCSRKQGVIGTTGEVRYGLSFGVEVAGFFWSDPDIYSAANVRLHQIQAYINKGDLNLVFPLLKGPYMI